MVDATESTAMSSNFGTLFSVLGATHAKVMSSSVSVGLNTVSN